MDKYTFIVMLDVAYSIIGILEVLRFYHESGIEFISKNSTRRYLYLLSIYIMADVWTHRRMVAV